MEFEWDERKRQRVLADRAIDFVLIAITMFDGRPLVSMPVTRGDEERYLSIAPIHGTYFAVVWTWREGRIRLITARRARNAEERQHRSLFP